MAITFSSLIEFPLWKQPLPYVKMGVGTISNPMSIRSYEVRASIASETANSAKAFLDMASASRRYGSSALGALTNLFAFGKQAVSRHEAAVLHWVRNNLGSW